MGDTFEFRDESEIVRLEGTLHDAASTAGDVLTVQADKSLAAKPSGAVPVIGRPKASGGTTYNGLPPGTSGQLGWTAFAFNDPALNGKVVYAPILITETVTLSEIEFMIDADPLADCHARAVIVAADTDWQPSGNILFQGEVAIPNGSVQFQTFSITGLAVTLTPGLYLWGAERDINALFLDGRPYTFPGSIHCDGSTPAGIIRAFTVSHVYGVFTNPLPRWDTAVAYAGGSLDLEPLVSPFIVHW